MNQELKRIKPLRPIVLDETGQRWEAIMDTLLSTCTHIVALRGAGSFNGISVADAKRIVSQEIIPRLESYLADGPVAILYDGDDDDPAYPDIGHVMGQIRDHFSFSDAIECYAVQKLSWYRYSDELPNLRPLHSVADNEYTTVLFPNDKFPGDHSHFTQNERLAESPLYEQWYIGACGQIADDQLKDYSLKAKTRDVVHWAIIFVAPVSVEQEQKTRERLVATDAILASPRTPEELSSAQARKKRLEDSLIRRAENPFGLLCDKAGNFLKKMQYDNLTIEIVPLPAAS